MGAPRHAAHRQSSARPLEDDDLSGCPAAPWVLDGPIDGETFRIYAEKVLVPTLQPGDIVIMDNLGSHKGKAMRQLIRSAGPSFSSCPNTLLTSTRSNRSLPSLNICCADAPPAPLRPSPPDDRAHDRPGWPRHQPGGRRIVRMTTYSHLDFVPGCSCPLDPTCAINLAEEHRGETCFGAFQCPVGHRCVVPGCAPYLPTKTTPHLN
jgi:hypothetical protein